MRKVKFHNGEYYHIFNRGVDKRKIFTEEEDLERFLQSMREFNLMWWNQSVAFMPHHFGKGKNLKVWFLRAKEARRYWSELFVTA